MTWSDAWRPADRAVAALSAIPPRPVAVLPSGLFAVAARERTASIVRRNARAMGLALPDVEEFERTATTLLARHVLAQHQARRVITAIGPEVIPLKGIWLAEHVYPEAGLRDMADLDLMVRRESVPAADRAIRDLGYRPLGDPAQLLSAGGDYLNAAAYAGDGLQVHLHWHLVNASVPLFMVARRIDLEEIWAESRPAAIAGAPCRAMAPPHLFVSLCEHALKHSFDALIHLVDLALVWPSVDPARALDVARRWGLARAVHVALLFAREALGLDADARAFDGRPSAELRWLVQRLRSNRRTPLVSTLGHLALAEGWRAKVRFVRESLRPPDAEVRGFGKTPGAGNVLRRTAAAVRRLLS